MHMDCDRFGCLVGDNKDCPVNANYNALPEPDHNELGCPQCSATDNLYVSQVSYEPVTFYADGEVNYPEGTTDYGTIINVFCGGCGWVLGTKETDLQAIRPGEDFIEAHKELIRAEILKELADD